MLFNSYSFLLVYLPLTLLGFFACARFGKAAGAAWLALCSLGFYGWWDAKYLTLLLASILGNYYAGMHISRHAGTVTGRRALILAITANLLILGYFKYVDFFLASVNALTGSRLAMLNVLLPIGVSFFTFTQIAFLADAFAGKVTEYRFTHYVLFVTYFPHLIAGPVLHHSEMMPQFDDDRTYRLRVQAISIGVTIFTLGLAKKVLIADNLSVHANPIFALDAANPSLFSAWSGVLAYTFQLYFDFSGYSDMAIGLSHMFNVSLPLNFNSPYKARNISEFWRRWHMTLSRFLRDYLYIPMGGNRHGAVRRHFNLMATMVLGGLWHGAGWTFVIWGALHGAYLVLHQGWQHVRARLPWCLPAPLGRVLATALTFLSVVIAWVYFRASDLTVAHRVLAGMAGQWGAALPEPLMTRLGPAAEFLRAAGIGSYAGGGGQFVEVWSWLAFSAVLVFWAPNSQEIVSRWRAALPGQSDDVGHAAVPTRLLWQPSKRHAAAVGLLLASCVMALSRPTEFLYFQF